MWYEVDTAYDILRANEGQWFLYRYVHHNNKVTYGCGRYYTKFTRPGNFLLIGAKGAFWPTDRTVVELTTEWGKVTHFQLIESPI